MTQLVYTDDSGATWSYQIPGDIVVGGYRVNTASVVVNEEWEDLVANSIYREVKEEGTAWLGYDPRVIQPNPAPDDVIDVAYRALAGTPEERYAAQASSLESEIQAQVPDATVRQRVIDPLIEADIGRYAGAASDKEIELQEAVEAGDDLMTFDPTLDVAPPQNGKGYAQLAVDIIELEPWAGAPDSNLGFEVVLNVQTTYEDQGAEARILVIDAPSDTGAVLPFVQDTEDPWKWVCQARDGHKWQDSDLSCTVQLLWGTGSLPASKKLKCGGQNDRQAALVRYAVPTT